LDKNKVQDYVLCTGNPIKLCKQHNLIKNFKFIAKCGMFGLNRLCDWWNFQYSIMGNVVPTCKFLYSTWLLIMDGFNRSNESVTHKGLQVIIKNQFLYGENEKILLPESFSCFTSV